jgi:hypothetical protein
VNKAQWRQIAIQSREKGDEAWLFVVNMGLTPYLAETNDPQLRSSFRKIEAAEINVEALRDRNRDHEFRLFEFVSEDQLRKETAMKTNDNTVLSAAAARQERAVIDTANLLNELVDAQVLEWLRSCKGEDRENFRELADEIEQALTERKAADEAVLKEIAENRAEGRGARS